MCRLFIGLGEAGFGAAVPLYYGLWYRREEIAVRISLYCGAGSLAGAFGGLIAYGVSFIHSKIATWRILFLIEGLPTILLAAIIFFCLPSTPEKSRCEWQWLSDQCELTCSHYRPRTRHHQASAVRPRRLACAHL